MSTNKNYPRWIYREGVTDGIIVKTVYEHMEMIEQQGYLGPALYDDELDELEKKIEETEIALKQMKLQRKQMLEKSAGAGAREKEKEEGATPVFTCEHCGKEFGSDAAVKGHMANCKKGK